MAPLCVSAADRVTLLPSLWPTNGRSCYANGCERVYSAICSILTPAWGRRGFSHLGFESSSHYKNQKPSLQKVIFRSKFTGLNLTRFLFVCSRGREGQMFHNRICDAHQLPDDFRDHSERPEWVNITFAIWTPSAASSSTQVVFWWFFPTWKVSLILLLPFLLST